MEGKALEEQLHELEMDVTARDKLRGNLGNPPKLPGEWQAHHVIPIEEYDHEVIAYVREHAGWDINAAENGVWLPEQAQGPLKGKLASHRGSHPAYTSSIEARLNQLIPEIDKVNSGVISARELRDSVDQIIAEYRAKMISEFKGVPLP